MDFKHRIDQEMYRPGIAISDVSNLCTGSKQRIQGQSIIFEGNGPRGGIRIYCYCIFHIDQKAKNYKYSL